MTKQSLTATVLALLFTTASGWTAAGGAADGSESLQQSWWLQFQQKENTHRKANPESNASAAPFAGTTGGAGSSEVLAGAVQKGYFTVPAYFGAQPQPYERPVDIVRTPAVAGWRSPLVGLTSIVPIPGIGLGSPFGLGGIGYGRGGWGIGSGWSGAGSGWGGLGSIGIGLGSIGLGWGGMRSCGGWGFGGPATAFWQTAPSKPSGNYFAPSTIDTSASGSYYATTTPALTPTFSQPKPVTNFWGSGSPFGRDATMPWNK